MNIGEIENLLTDCLDDMIALFAQMPPDLRVMMLRMTSRQLATVAEFGSMIQMREDAR